MKRRLATVLAIAALLCTSLGVTVAPVLADGGSCSEVFDGFYENGDIVGQTNSAPGVSRSGIQATIKTDDAATGFKMCQQTSYDIFDNGVLAYVQLYPHNSIGGCSTGPASLCYIRMGVAKCVSGQRSFCDPGPTGGSTRHIFFERRGCGVSPAVHDYGVSVDNTTPITFYRDTGNVWHFIADGVEQGTVPNSDSRLTCWINGVDDVAWTMDAMDDGTGFDPGGDSLGTVNTANSGFTGARYGIFGSGWFNPGWTTGATCTGIVAGTDEVCKVSSTNDSLKIWTLN